MKIFYQNTLTIVLLFILVSCGGGEPDQTQFRAPGNFRGGQTTSVEVIPVQTGTISEQVRSYGSVQAQDIVNIVPQVSNRITKIHVDLGDDVTQGQVLAEIYAVPFQDAVEQAQAQIRQARAAFERDSTQMARQQQLLERDLISRSEFDDVRAAYLNSQAQLESARAALTQSLEDLENTTIESPVNGVVLSRSIAEGDVATTGQTAFEIANLTGFETRVFLPLQDWELVQVGQEVSMALSTRGTEVATGVVSRKSPRLDPTTGLGEVVITLTESTSSVYQGALVQAKINLETRENVIVIPRTAMVEKVDTYIEPETGTIELERTYSAFVNQGDSIAVQKDLVLGIEQGDQIEVIEGLQPGDGLIVTGQQNLEDSSRISIAGSDPPNVSNGSARGDQRGRTRSGNPEERREGNRSENGQTENNQ